MSTPAYLLQAFSVQIYEPPLSRIREAQDYPDLTDPVTTLMLAVDFETEVSMNGITNFIGNSTGRYAPQTIQALEFIGCPTQAARLREILSIATSAGMTYEAVQCDLEGRQAYEVVTFSQVHGIKWQAVTSAIAVAASPLDLEDIYERAESFIAANQEAFNAVIRPSQGPGESALARPGI